MPSTIVHSIAMTTPKASDPVSKICRTKKDFISLTQDVLLSFRQAQQRCGYLSNDVSFKDVEIFQKMYLSNRDVVSFKDGRSFREKIHSSIIKDAKDRVAVFLMNLLSTHLLLYLSA
jgi:hypothetical protein